MAYFVALTSISVRNPREVIDMNRASRKESSASRYTRRVNVLPALRPLAHSLPALPLEAIENLLVNYDTLVSLGDSEVRLQAAQCLRDAAAQASDPKVRDRLLRAAEAVASGLPCAFTPEGLTGPQAAAQTMSLEEWQSRPAPAPPVGNIDRLNEVWDRLEDLLCAAEDKADSDDETLEPIRNDIEEARAWLSTDGDRGDPPPYESQSQVADVFGARSEFARKMDELFAGMSSEAGE